MKEKPRSEFSIPVDLVLIAAGFLCVDHGKLVNDLDLKLDDRGNIRIAENYETSIPGVFCAGDSYTGASLVVKAIHHGREAARYIDEYLREQTRMSHVSVKARGALWCGRTIVRRLLLHVEKFADIERFINSSSLIGSRQ